MSESPSISDDDVDHAADEEILACMTDEFPRSFFLFAGAGSGKTRSLVKALQDCLSDKEAGLRKRLRNRGQSIAVITYTNAACDEIKERIQFDPLVQVSTIHSFSWELIKGHNASIRSALENRLRDEIAELEVAQAKGRASKASETRERRIKSTQMRIAALPDIREFTYNPNGDNKERDALNHEEVIQITASFLTEKPLLARILISRFPIVFIDECQDTKKKLMEALLEVEQKHSGEFMLGLFGDMMQRIYGDGKEDLDVGVPENWATPVKKMNHRSAKRIITLINQIRSATDSQIQQPRQDKEEGVVRLFLLNKDTLDKDLAEERVRAKMAELCDDSLWAGPEKDVKTLILEHRMSASRMGFLKLYNALHREEKFRTGLLDGTLPELRIFSNEILPLLEAEARNDQFGAMAVLKRASPLLTKKALDQSNSFKETMVTVREAVEMLTALANGSDTVTFGEVLQAVAAPRLFRIPESLEPFAYQRIDTENEEDPADGNEDTPTPLEEFLNAPFAEIKPYTAYVEGMAEFGTHQGVKGLEFPRVMAIADDFEAKGFLFSYEKLFGTKALSKADNENINAGKETGIDRTRRLFYVTCSRAEKSLAIVAYTANPSAATQQAIQAGWVTAEEIEII